LSLAGLLGHRAQRRQQGIKRLPVHACQGPQQSILIQHSLNIQHRLIFSLSSILPYSPTGLLADSLLTQAANLRQARSTESRTPEAKTTEPKPAAAEPKTKVPKIRSRKG